MFIIKKTKSEKPLTSTLTSHVELKKLGLRINNGFDTRGKKIALQFESPVQLNNASMFVYKNLKIGMYTYLRTGILRNVESIGRYCSIGPNVTIGEMEHPTNWLSTSPAQYSEKQFAWFEDASIAKKRITKKTKNNDDGAAGNVIIGNDVWIGGGATIRRGIKIGHGAIIAGGAFVTKDVEPYSIVAGIPAKHIRYRFPQEICDALLTLQWWRFDINDLAGINFDQIERAIEEINMREKNGSLQEKPACFNSVVLESKGFSDFKEHAPTYTRTENQ